MKRSFIIAAVCALMISALAACSDAPVPTAEPSPAPTAVPTAVPTPTPAPTPTASPAATPDVGDALEYDTVRTEHEITPDSGEPFTFFTETPHFGVDAVDAYFENKAAKFYDGMFTELMDVHPDAELGYACDLTYEVTYNRGGIASIVFTKYVNLGGAHPNVTYECDTIDVRNSARLTLSDVIPGSREALFELAAAELESLGIAAPDDGTSLREIIALEIDDTSFSLGGDSLSLYFSEYTFGYPGSVSVSVSYDALESAGALAEWVRG